MMAELDDSLQRFFARCPQAMPLYQRLAELVQQAIPPTTVKVQRSQIALTAPKSFAYVWLPIRTIRGRPETYIIVTFGLRRRLESPRIVEAVEPYPGRWTHHVIVSHPEEVDDELLGWIQLAYVSIHTDQPSSETQI